MFPPSSGQQSSTNVLRLSKFTWSMLALSFNVFLIAIMCLQFWTSMHLFLVKSRQAFSPGQKCMSPLSLCNDLTLELGSRIFTILVIPMKIKRGERKITGVNQELKKRRGNRENSSIQFSRMTGGKQSQAKTTWEEEKSKDSGRDQE